MIVIPKSDEGQARVVREWTGNERGDSRSRGVRPWESAIRETVQIGIFCKSIIIKTSDTV
jgi:hypothetical protein